MSTVSRRILLAASEIFPLAKTGGLADATAALGAALAQLGQDVQFVMPAYTQALETVVDLQPAIALPVINGLEGGLVLPARMPDSGVPINLIDIPALYRDGGGLYVDANGNERQDNPERFAALAQAISHLALGETGLAAFDIVHCNDWHTGLVPLLLNNFSHHPPASIFTIHNIAFQGLCPLALMPALGVDVPGGRIDRIEFYGQASFLKAGLEFADELTTVSPRYAEEIQTPDFGFGMEGVIGARRERLTGILNGIDTTFWTPLRSPWLAASYGPGAMGGKALCKQWLQQRLGLAENPAAPLMAFIGRLTWQKMADVLLEAAPAYLAAEGDRQFALLGSGDRSIEEGFIHLAKAFPGRVSVNIGYSEPDAQQLHAGSDLLIHGSRFEPCGLTQLYAMHFGTIPIVRPVGGLADTVVDVSPETLALERATGFYFIEPTAQAMLEGIDRAVALYRQPERWSTLQATAMSQVFSWEKAAVSYLRVYDRALAGRAASRP
ncbi:MAG: glycogen synthase GlgA [Wenzhouxiangella sp.]